MIIAQWTFTPGKEGLTPVVKLLAAWRDAWTRANGVASAGRILGPYSGLDRCAVWQFHAPTLAEHDEARARWQAEAGSLILRMDAVADNDVHRVFTVIGHHDENEPARADGVVVQ